MSDRQGGGYGSRLENYKNPVIRKSLEIIYPPAPFFNVIPKAEKQKIQTKIFGKALNCKILDIGSGLTKGPGSWLWRNQPKDNITRVDIVDGPNIDVVADATDLPFANNSYDSVILQSVVEHVEDKKALLDECVRVLKPGGYIYIEMPFLQGLHGDPSDFWRMTQNGLRSQLNSRNIELILEGVSGGPMGTLIWIISDLVSYLTKRNLINLVIRFIFRWLLSPLKYLDFVIQKTPAASRTACELYYLGTRK
jgi:SAM-dependent methyltransferase